MHIAYLGPEIPALSATFVYREILALRERGHKVTPFTVRPPAALATDVDLGVVDVLYGGAAQQLLGTATSFLTMPGQGLSIFVKALGDTINGVGTSNKALGLPWQAAAGLRLATTLKAIGADHLHVHFAHFPTQIAMYASDAAGLPFTVMGHANDLYENPLLLPQKAERSAGFTTISAHNVELLVDMGVTQEKLSVTRCGLPHLPETLPGQRALQGPITIGSLGRLVEKKGMLDLIKAFSALRASRSNLRLEIVGDGPQRSAMEVLIVEHGLEEDITLRGALPNSEVLSWLDRLDLFVLACRQDQNGDKDGIPVALMEAMMKGIPVVSSRLTGIPELILDRETGYLSEPAHPESLAATIDLALVNDTERKTIRKQALDHLHREFSMDVNMKRLETLFEGARP